MQTCGVTLREIRAADRLLAINGDDVVVNGYPTSKEDQVRKKRGSGTAGAMKRWGKKSDSGRMASANGKHDGIPIAHANGSSNGTAIASRDAEGEGEGEGERKENGSAIPPAMPSGIDETDIAKPTPPPPAGRRRSKLGDLQAIFPELVVFGNNRDQAETILELYEWEPCVKALTFLQGTVMLKEPGKQRIMVEEMANWLKGKFQLFVEDYQRAGITPPPGTANAT
jgi:hypothetical protein